MNYDKEPYQIQGPMASIEDWHKVFSTKSSEFEKEEEWRISDTAGKLLNGCDLLIMPEHPDISKLPINFRQGFIYNTQAAPEHADFFFFDKKKQNPLIPLNPIPTNINSNNKNALIEIIEMKRRVPKIAHFSNKELLFLRENFCLTHTGELFPCNPVTLEPTEIKKILLR